MNGHPVTVRLDDDLRRSRLTVFFRLLLAIPHFVWAALWTIGIFFAAIVSWFAALFTGRVPAGLHDFLSSYVRYLAHLIAYLTVVANPYPGFTGEPGYPLDIELPAPERQRRWTILLRILLWLPVSLLAAAVGFGIRAGGASSGKETGEQSSFFFSVGGALAACAILGWFAALVLGRSPNGLRDLGAYAIGYNARSGAYVLLLTDRYPTSDPESLGPAWSLPPHQIELALADDGRRSRLTVLFRFLLALPHFVWWSLWSIAVFFAGIVNGLVALVRGRSAEPLHRFLAAYVRYSAHLTAFVGLVANPFPGFVGSPGYPVDIVVGAPERQHRLVTLFRIFLAIPALIVSSALTGVLLVVAFLGWFASLARGRMPTGMRNLGAVCVRYMAQTHAYWLVVTDTYPYASPALRPPPEPEPETAPEPMVEPTGAEL